MKNVLALAGLLCIPVAAAQEGLYAPAPPANSAFVRVLNTSGATLGTAAVSADKAASPYVVIPQGDFNAKLGTASAKLKVEAGKFYSVANVEGKVILLTDQAATNRAKALLTVYNLSKVGSIDLKTADGKTAVVTGVKAGGSGNRAVNGVTVDLAAFSGAKSLGAVKGVKLERGNAYALVVTDSGMTVTQSSTKTK